MSKTEKLKQKLATIEEKIVKYQNDKKKIIEQIEAQEQEEILKLIKDKKISVEEIAKLLRTV